MNGRAFELVPDADVRIAFQLRFAVGSGQAVPCIQQTPITTIEMGGVDLSMSLTECGLLVTETPLACKADFYPDVWCEASARKATSILLSYDDLCTDFGALFSDEETYRPLYDLHVFPGHESKSGHVMVEKVSLSALFESGRLDVHIDAAGSTFELGGCDGSRRFCIDHEALLALVFSEVDCG